jgi:hypothetical protein
MILYTTCVPPQSICGESTAEKIKNPNMQPLKILKHPEDMSVQGDLLTGKPKQECHIEKLQKH